MPAGLHYLDSWTSADLQICYQLMEADDFDLFAVWTREWKDLIEFEVVPIIPSGEPRAKAIETPSAASPGSATMNPTGKIFPGMIGTESTIVTREITVAHYHPEMPEVYGTPFMIYLMEVAASNAIQQQLPAGWVSVGYEVNVKHTALTPVGRTAIAHARVDSISGRLVTFSVEAHDGVAQIGIGSHVRAVVELSRFEKNLRGS